MSKTNSSSETAQANFLHRYVKPHTKPGRKVVESDLPRILEGDGTPENPGEIHVLYALCYTPRPGKKVAQYRRAFAMAHTQIDDQDPLALFVTREGYAIINPLIITHTKAAIFQKEGCMTFPDDKVTMVGRYHKITVAYQTITEEGTLSKDVESDIKGIEAQVWQHEIDHLNGKYIYDIHKAVSVQDDPNPAKTV